MEIQDVSSLEFDELSSFFSSENEINIYFTLKGHENQYILIIRKINDLWKVTGIEHNALYLILKNINNPCPFCGDSTGICSELNRKKEEIHNKIVQHPKVRLKLLFMKDKNL